MSRTKRTIAAAFAAAALAVGSMGTVAVGAMHVHGHPTHAVADDGMYHHS